MLLLNTAQYKFALVSGKISLVSLRQVQLTEFSHVLQNEHELTRLGNIEQV